MWYALQVFIRAITMALHQGVDVVSSAVRGKGEGDDGWGVETMDVLITAFYMGHSIVTS